VLGPDEKDSSRGRHPPISPSVNPTPSPGRWRVGDIFRTDDGRKLRIVSQIPIEKIHEFRDKPKYATWEVEVVFDG
jgi:hypothetical protein